MSIYNVVYGELHLNNKDLNKGFYESFEKRKSLAPISALKETLVEVFNIDIDFDYDQIEYFDVRYEGGVIQIAVEGLDADTIVEYLGVSLNSYIDTLYIIQYFEYEYCFRILGKKGYIDSNFGVFSNDYFEKELEKENPSKKEILKYFVDKYESGVLVEKKISLEEIFTKISDISIDPIDDGYYFDIKNRCEIGSNGETILTWAIKNENISLISQMLQDGDPEPALITNKDGKSASDVSQELGNPEIIEIINSVL